MELMIAVTLAIVFGGLQFFLLWKGIRSMARGQLNVLYFVTQFFCPLAGLGLCTWLAKGQLMLCAGIICGILMLGAIVYSIDTTKRKKV